MWREPVIPNSDLQAINCRVVAYEALVKVAFAFQYPSLHALSGSPANRHCDNSCSVSDRVCRVSFPGLEHVRIRALLECHLRVKFKNWIVRGQRQCMGHRGFTLVKRLCGVATAASSCLSNCVLPERQPDTSSQHREHLRDTMATQGDWSRPSSFPGISGARAGHPDDRQFLNTIWPARCESQDHRDPVAPLYADM